jgi:hypothetical protein
VTDPYATRCAKSHATRGRRVKFIEFGAVRSRSDCSSLSFDVSGYVEQRS